MHFFLYFSRHKNLLQDYRWNPADVKTTTDAASPALGVVEDRRTVESKFVVYTGFIHSAYVPVLHSWFRQFLASPWTFFTTTLPAHLGFEHSALKFLNCLIANSAQELPGGAINAYAFNDGISPISSGLLLSNPPSVSAPLVDEENYLRSLQERSKAGKVRIFENVDHLTFIDGHGTSESSQVVTDLLAAKKRSKPMFDWILEDLLAK